MIINIVININFRLQGGVMNKTIIKLFVPLLILVFISGISVFGCTKEISYEITSQDRVILAQPSVCYIATYYYAYVYDAWYDEWSELYYYGPLGGTGFCVNPNTGHIVTAGHVVDTPVDEIKYTIIEAYINDYYDVTTFTDEDWDNAFNTFRIEGENGPDPDREIWVQFNTATAGLPDNTNENYTRAELIDLSPWEQRDLAILRTTPVTGRSLSGIMLGDSSMTEIQDNITIIGYPWTAEVSVESIMTPTVASGVTSAKRMVGGTEVIQVDITAAPGNSGSPVLNDSGGVIGVLTMGTTENVNFLRPSSDVAAMLSKNGVTNEQGMVDEEFKQGLIMYRLKYYSEAIENLNAVLNLNQGHLLAQEYRSKSQEAINREEEEEFKEGTEINIVE
jgi:V8-like Glu-specific endopeptidase